MPSRNILPAWALVATLLLALLLAVVDNCRHGRPLRIEQKLLQQEIGKRI